MRGPLLGGTRAWRLALVLLGLGAPGCDNAAPPTEPPPPGPGPIAPPPAEPVPQFAFTHTTIVVADGTNAVLSDHTVVTHGDSIVAVGPSATTPVPDSATVIDASGQYLLPGLTDFHVHVTVGSADAARDQGVLFVGNGVTTILNMGDVGINGDIRDYQRAYLQGDAPGPTMFVGKFARGPEDGGASFGLVVSNASSASGFVSRARADGYDFIKTYNWLRVPVWQALVREGEAQGLPVIGHVPVTMGMSDALLGGQRMIAHASEYFWQHYDTLQDDRRTQRAIDLTLGAGAWVTPTLSASEGVIRTYGNNSSGYRDLIGRPSYRYVHPDIRQHWRTWLNNGSIPGARDSWLPFMQSFIGDFHEAGVRMLIGTDAPDVAGLASGFAVHEEFRLLEAAGLGAASILEMATRSAGDFIAATLPDRQPFGRVSIGHRADLLLVRANPLDDLAHLHDRTGVMVRGAWWTQTALNAAMDSVASTYGGGS